MTRYVPANLDQLMSAYEHKVWPGGTTVTSPRLPRGTGPLHPAPGNGHLQTSPCCTTQYASNTNAIANTNKNTNANTNANTSANTKHLISRFLWQVQGLCHFPCWTILSRNKAQLLTLLWTSADFAWRFKTQHLHFLALFVVAHDVREQWLKSHWLLTLFRAVRDWQQQAPWNWGHFLEQRRLCLLAPARNCTITN